MVVFGCDSVFETVCSQEEVSSGYREVVSAMRIPRLGCVVRSITAITNAKGEVALSESMVFVPGAKIEEVIDTQEKVIGRKLVADYRKY